jgi:hypothetical protein
MAATGQERARRPDVEIEADLFAAELLMPEDAVRRRFLARFRKPVNQHEVDNQDAFWLTRATGRPLNEIELRSNLRSLSRAIAEARSLGSHNFEPLYREFDVSPVTMAIQLEELGFVR